MPPAFVINLQRSGTRRQHMRSQLAALRIDAEFVPAVDGRALSDTDRARYDRSRAMRTYGVDMTDAELACYLSHYRLLERMLEQDIEVALIMEDDIEIAPVLPATVEALVREPEWLVVRLEAIRGRVRHPKSRWDLGQLVADLDCGALYRLNTHALGLGAYLVRKAGARRIVEYGRRIFMPIDHTVDRFWENGVAPYVVRPLPVRQSQAFGSEIGARDPRRRRSLPPADRLRFQLQRTADSINKRLYWLARSWEAPRSRDLRPTRKGS
jgi:glycosyl transferase family 25